MFYESEQENRAGKRDGELTSVIFGRIDFTKDFDRISFMRVILSVKFGSLILVL